MKQKIKKLIPIFISTVIIVVAALSIITGIKKNTGSFYFYDGRLIGNTAAKPEIATSTEYLYETKEELNAEDGNYHCILDWIRQTDGS